jgi:uncharacterized protein YigE (DUF2233 family)
MTTQTVLFAGTPFTVATVEPKKDDLRLLWKDESGQRLGDFDAVERWAQKSRKSVLLATNAGIFAPGFTPLGIHIEQGRELVKLNRWHGGGNFFLKPNGVFFVTTSGKSGVLETEEFAKNKLKLRLATQSGPLLVQRGKIHPKFTRGSANRNLRNGIGATKDGRAIIVLSHLPVNFWDFATLFRDRLGCPDALYLDGAISGMRCPQADCRRDGSANFAGILAVLR